jgi:hypothetical protein
LDEAHIKRLCAIKVIRDGWSRRKKPNPIRRLGHSTWIVGTKGLKNDPNDWLQEQIDRRNRELNERLGTDEEFDWIQWGKKSRFGRECRAGDTLIVIFVPYGGGRPSVTRSESVVLRDKEPIFNRFYTQALTRLSDEVSWSRFQRILKAVGFKGKVTLMSTRKLDPDMAALIDRRWTRIK